MTLALVLGVMAVSAAALLAIPLFRKGAPPSDRAAFDRAVYRDQLRELERDQARGVIGEEEARAARIEIERRILSTAPDSGDGIGGAPPKTGSYRHARTSILVLLFVMPLAAMGLYLALGTPRLPGQPFAQRIQANATPEGLTGQQIEKMVAMLERRLAEHPEEIEGWTLLSTAYVRVGRLADAEGALIRALDLSAGDKARGASIAARYGEALVALHDGRVVPRAKSAFSRAFALAPDNPAAAYYLGLAQLQAGDKEGALKIWQELAGRAPPDAPWLPGLKERITRVAKEGGIDLRTLEGTPRPGP